MAVLELNALSVDLSGSFSADVFVPENASLTGGKKYPALFFYHDIGGNNTDIRSIKGLEALATELGMFIIAPALMHSFGLDLEWGGKYGHFAAVELPGICRHMFPIDKERCYAGGTGWGAYGAVMSASTYPDAFAKVICVDGMFDIARLCADCLAGEALPHLRRPHLEALFAPLEQVSGSKFDLLAPGHAMPKQLYLACEDTNLDDTKKLAKAVNADIHTGSTEQALYSGALRWLCK